MKNTINKIADFNNPNVLIKKQMLDGCTLIIPANIETYEEIEEVQYILNDFITSQILYNTQFLDEQEEI